jgi:hypothetical protein
MDSITEFFDFILSEKEAITEDFLSVKIYRMYEKNYLTKLAEIFAFCNSVGIGFDFTVFIVLEDGSRTILTTNFDLRQEGIRELYTLTKNSARKGIKQILAGIKSLRKDVQRATPLDSILVNYIERIWVSISINKSDVQRFLNTQYPLSACSYHFWVIGKHMWETLSSDPKTFLKSLWQGDFPIIVLLDITKTLVLNFCILSNTYIAEPVSQKRLESHRIIKFIAKKIFDHDAALPYLLQMTLSSPDNESAKYIKEMVPENISKIVNMKFPFAEDQFYDFKEKCNPSDVVKEIVSFANSCGGLLIYGVNDKGEVSGTNIKSVTDSITNAINSQLTSGVPIPRYEIFDVSLDNDNSIITVLVYPPKGDETYYLKDGRRPFRMGSTTEYIAQDDDIREQRRRLFQSVCNEF